jgi:dTDP-4-amino-4,6-dideoxygalactose transaminase
MLRASWNRDRIVDALQVQGIGCMQGSCSEVYREKAFLGTEALPKKRLPIARELGETSLALLVDHTLSEDYLDRACDAVRAVMKEAVR